jgi:hypothetical protein
MDSEPVRDEKEEYMLLRRHYGKLMEFQVFRESRFVFIPENNLGLESAHLDAMVHTIPNVETFWNKPNKPGVLKDGAVTREYQFLLSLRLAEDGIRFDREWFTVSRDQTTRTMSDTLQEQMLRYHWESKPAPDIHGKTRYALTGKVGNKQDDLLVALAMFLYWSRVVMLHPDRLK